MSANKNGTQVSCIENFEHWLDLDLSLVKNIHQQQLRMDPFYNNCFGLFGPPQAAAGIAGEVCSPASQRICRRCSFWQPCHPAGEI